MVVERRGQVIAVGLGQPATGGTGRAHREPAGQEDGDAPEPDARHAFGGQTDPTDALPAIEHSVVTEVDRAKFQHVPSSGLPWAFGSPKLETKEGP